MSDTEELQVCTHSTWGSYTEPPDHCDNDAEPGTDPPRCAAHPEEEYDWDYEPPDYYDD